MNKAKRENYYEAKRALEQIDRILATQPLTPNEWEELQLQKVIEGLEGRLSKALKEYMEAHRNRWARAPPSYPAVRAAFSFKGIRIDGDGRVEPEQR